MAAAAASSSAISALPSPSSSQPLYLLLLSRPPTPSRLRLRLHLHLRHTHLLPVRSRPHRPSTRCCCSSAAASYNGWADLPAADDPLGLPFLRITQQSLAAAPLLLLLPVAALSLSRLPPAPLLAAVFAAGFATARHLAPAPGASSTHRLAALLADLDARLLSLKGRLLASAPADGDHDDIEPLDRARDALLECAAAVAAGQGQGQGSSSNAGGAAPDDGALQDVAREVAGYIGGWAKAALRELSFASPRKKPAKAVAPDASTADAKSNSGSAVAQQGDGENKPADSAAVGSARPLDMLPFDGKDAASGFEDAGFSSESGQEDDDRLERLVSKHRYGRGGRVPNDGPFQEGGRFAAAESAESSLLERTLEIRDRSYRLKIERRDGGESRVSGARGMPADEFVGSAAASVEEQPLTDDDEGGAGVGSDAEEFGRNVKEAAEILRKARECMMARDDEEAADALLYRSARLLSTAVALRPTSLVAVGQLGNTYLLHGELKLKISRELRTLLANSGAYINGGERVSRSRKLDRRILNRENISSALVGVCEECESLLVEAGRSYRTAVSIDSGDVKALYNWGLALIFRGQLLADIGPEAAVDADRVYLAAIDKFDAMLSKSNTYAPEALYRWGSALQQRSQLRSRNNKEKIRLLEQAKSLFEDVLYVEGNNKMVREALSSCISELNYHGRWLQ
ncbi:hypothetical protein CFC21_100857 [Triticum aestivum]|uniref:Uncharacterized protein n=2 Tax=Triticum aestivum TaxID=4565 RepID=A0A9R1M222_WHEAT|nr:uncharacterized protein LOC123149909 [Triticum aestivum]XP_044445045.1 uncharacterized protein LOC123172071 [Triticum aestivum]KAF7099186.1 hypothetical protein CFC21_100857 [Triticum aestivum]